MRTGSCKDVDLSDACRASRPAAALPFAAALVIAGAAPLAAAVPSDSIDKLGAPTRIASPPVVEPRPSDPQPTRFAPGTITVRAAADGPELVVALSRPAPAAAFRYGRHLWIVVASGETLKRARAAASDAHLFAEMEVTPLKDATALRLRYRSGRRLTAVRSGAVWRFTYGRADGPAAARRGPEAAALRPVLRRSTLTGTVVAVADARLATVHRLVDPVVGTTLVVVTSADPAVAVRTGYRAAAFRLLPTRLGVAVEVRADGVGVDRDDSGIRIRYRRAGEPRKKR